MRFIAAITLLAAVSVTAQAKDTYVSPHTTKNGTYVQGHYQTEANSTKLDNYSTKGNVNPYTGKAGTVDPYKTDGYGLKPSRKSSSLYDLDTDSGKKDD